MTSNRPYLLRALFDWINDNQLTPFLLVNATLPEVRVPQGYVKDGQIVLNISMGATQHLELGNDAVRFHARFSGISQSIIVPVSAILAIYARENGKGMMFPVEEQMDNEPPPIAPAPAPEAKNKPTPRLRVVK